MGGISGANMASLTSERDKLREEADTNARRMEARNIRNNKLSAENAKLKSQAKLLSDSAELALAQRDASNNRVRELEAQLACLGDKLKEVVVPSCARELCSAAREGNAGAISVLLNGSAPPNAREQCAQALGRALCAAVIGKHVQVVQLLLTHKPEFSATLVESGEECQCNCAESGDEDDACECHIPVVHLAARGGCAELVEMIIRASPAQLITARDSEGRTPLHLACELPSPQIAMLLLARGADPSAIDDDGYRPVDVASEEGHTEVVAALEASVGRMRNLLVRGLTAMEEGDAVLSEQLLGAASVELLDQDSSQLQLSEQLTLWSGLTKAVAAIGGNDMNCRVVEAAGRALALCESSACSGSMVTGEQARIAMLQLRAPSCMALCDHEQAMQDYGELERSHLGEANNSASGELRRQGWAEMKGEAAALSQATYYEVLCVERTAMLAAIKKAYYRLSKQWHPDKHSAKGQDAVVRAKRMFARVSTAWETLSDVVARDMYNLVLPAECAPGQQPRAKCDQKFFEEAMGGFNMHEHCNSFDDNEFDDYLKFMQNAMGNPPK